MRQVFLDYQAGTPVPPEVWEAMKPFFTEWFGNASSLHQQGLVAREALDQARARVAGLIHADPADDIIFTSGGTESANLAVKGVAWANQRRGRHLVLSAVEHPSITQSVEFLEQHGFTATRVPVNAEGKVDPEAIREALRADTILVCLQHANHDIGTVQPVREVGRITSERGIPLFVDATSSGGWLPVDVQAMGANLLSLSPHRFYGPKGAGVLYRNRRARLAGIQHGGVQESGRRAGTENVPAIVGAGMAAELARLALPDRQEKTGRLQRRLWEGLQKSISLMKLNGPVPGPGRMPANLNLSFEFIEGEGLLLLSDTQGIAMASGTSCISKSLKVSPVLTAIGLDYALAQGTVLLSLGQETTESEIDQVIAKLPGLVARLRDMSPSWDEFQRGAIQSILGPESRGKAGGAASERGSNRR